MNIISLLDNMAFVYRLQLFSGGKKSTILVSLF